MSNAMTKEYVVNQIKNASPLELVVIAYDNAINHLESAKQALADKKITVAAADIVKAQKFIRELRNALDMSVEDISGMLFAIYRVLDKNLTRASQQKDAQQIDKVIAMLRELKDAWEQLSRQAPVEQSQKKDAADGRDFNYVNVYR